MKIKKVVLALTLLPVLMSCSPENGYSEFERTQAYFLDKLEGNVSPSQWWKTSVTIKVDVRTNSPVKLMLMSDAGKGTLYDYKEVTESGTYMMTAPQGKGSNVYLTYICNKKKDVKVLTLSGKGEERIVVDTTVSGERNVKGVKTYDASSMVVCGAEDDNYHFDPKVSAALHGNSVSGGAFHLEFDKYQRLEVASLVNMMIRSQDAKRVLGLNCDYELESNGPFDITWLAGYEADQTEHLLGYYYHSPDTYDDMVFCDLSETHKYDIIDGFAKVQYQIDDATSQAHIETGIFPNKWYDANYDLLDVFNSSNACKKERIGDDAYNSLDVFKTFEKGITRLRGLSFRLNVPEGMRIGFYLKANEKPDPEQWDMLRSLGIKGIGNRADWKATNFCAESFNQNQTHRSCIIPYEHTTWMGMEDIIGGGDFDCNDVMFGITPEVGIFKPTVVVPDINFMVNTSEKMPWTIAYEDVGRDADFDFNDAVIKLVPDFDKELCCVTVEAAGSPHRMYLHYDGPDGDVNLGEIHELLSRKVGSIVNTTSAVPQTPFVEIDCVPWPKDYTMGTDARRFWIEIQRGTCEDCTDAITLAYEPGRMPEAMLIAGEWQWPMEGVHIFSAYNSFPNWAKDVSRTSYWSWYSSSNAGTVVSY